MQPATTRPDLENGSAILSFLGDPRAIRLLALFRALAVTVAFVAVLEMPTAQASSYTPTTGTDFFTPSGVWNQPLDANAPLASNSSTLVSTLNWEVNNYGAWINTDQYSTGVYTVPSDQPTVHVTLDHINPQLAADFDQVPLPPDAHPAQGTDGHLVVWQPVTQTMWEFWQLHTDGSGNWHTSYGGKMTNVSSNPGYFSQQFGATATGLPLVGGLMTLQEETDGVINHALQLAIPHAKAGTWTFPAQRTDGDNAQATAIPEGTRFRLPANLVISPVPRQTAMMARAAQRYGIIVNDQSGVVSFRAEDPYLYTQKYGFDPYGPFAFEALSPSQLLAFFPWQELQVVSPDEPAPAAADDRVTTPAGASRTPLAEQRAFGPPPARRPVVTGLRQSRTRWRLGKSRVGFAKARLPVGTTFTFSLNAPAAVRFDFTQRAGRTVNRRIAGRLSFSAHTGRNKVHFEGRISQKQKLKPGRYTLVVTASDSAGNKSNAAGASFTIVR